MKFQPRFIVFITLFAVKSVAQSSFNIIPKPQYVQAQSGEFVFTENTAFSSDTTLFQPILELLKSRWALKVARNSSNQIHFKYDKTLPAEGYELAIDPNEISIISSSGQGAFYAFQSLVQLLPPQYMTRFDGKINIPCGIIKDMPRYPHRGVMIDAGRHFFSIDFLKKFIDVLAVYKLNTFHWHLTEDQGWRIEIKKYPRLTEVGSKRSESMVGYSNAHQFDGKPYGGYYTQEQIKELVRYAQKRYITIIPEIEMPGHSLAALAAYPEYSCSDAPITVKSSWGVEENIYCPYEKTFTFLEDVLNEVIELFPSEYIHIGGDESPKTYWKNSAFCQALIKKEGLKDEHELQSYFIKRIDKFLTSKGRKIIGWNEILEGGISPNATIMSWQGTEGGIAAANQKHKAIMTPSSNCYFDFYQGDPLFEPISFRNPLYLEKVYNYNPTPTELTAEQAQYIIGTQANIWSEYIADSAKLEYMAFPRVTALAEVAWTQPQHKNFDEYVERLRNHFRRFESLNVNYSKSHFSVTSKLLNKDGKNRIELSKLYLNGQIRYTLNGSDPKPNSTLYNEKPIKIENNTTIKAALFDKNGEALGPIFSRTYRLSKATGKTYTLPNISKRYTGGSEYGLTNGLLGDVQNDFTWAALEGSNLNLVLDMGKETKFKTISTRFKLMKSWGSLLPTKIEISISDDGQNYKTLRNIDYTDRLNEPDGIFNFNQSVGKQKARYIKITGKNYGKLNTNYYGQSNLAWIILDEIIVE